MLPPAEPTADFDVARSLQHFIALRQEVNLQTKSTGAQIEQKGQALALLQKSLDAPGTPRPRRRGTENMLEPC